MKEDFETQLRNKGYKVTPQRTAICYYILNSRDHPSVDDVHEALKKKYPSMSIATVYKTVTMLKEMNLITELTFKGQNTRYDPNKSLHVNVICPKCSKISDRITEKIRILWEGIEEELGGQLLEKRIDVEKICYECSLA